MKREPFTQINNQKVQFINVKDDFVQQKLENLKHSPIREADTYKSAQSTIVLENAKIITVDLSMY